MKAIIKIKGEELYLSSITRRNEYQNDYGYTTRKNNALIFSSMGIAKDVRSYIKADVEIIPIKKGDNNYGTH